MEGTIWWKAFCGNNSLYYAFWSPALSLETYNPDLTLCMQRSLLLWIPASFLLIFSLPYIYYIQKLPTIHNASDFSKLNFIKVLLGILMVITSLVNLGITCQKLTNQDDVHPVDISYDVIRALTLVLVTWLTHREYIKGITTSSTVSVFWALYGVAQIIIVRSAYIRKFSQTSGPESDLEFGLDVTFSVLVLSELFASSFADTAALRPTNRTIKRTGSTTEETTPLLAPKAKDDKKQARPEPTPVPELTSSFWMKATFQWMWPAVIRGSRKTVKLDDIYDIRPEDKCATTLKTFYKFFSEKNISACTSYYEVRRVFARALFETVYWPYIWGFSLKVVSTFAFLINPQILSLMLTYIDSSDVHTWKAWVLGFLLFAAGAVGAIARHGYYYIGWNAGLKARSVINAAVCRKALQLSEGSKKTTTVGEMVNLLAVDAQKIQDMVIYTNVFLDLPLHIVFGCVMIWLQVGWACIAGIAVIAVMIPLNSLVITNKCRSLQMKQMVHKDNRLRMVNEILNGIKILKLYAWEPSFMAQTSAYRSGEVYNLRHANRLIAILTINLFMLPYLMSLAIFAVYVMTSADHSLSPQTAFVTLAYINSFQIVTSGIPMLATYYGQGIVSTGRLAAFLAMDELNQANIEKDSKITGALEVENASFAWESEEGTTTLHNINLEVKQGELVAVVGQVGAGKSSLLSAILGEITKVKGHVKVNGKFAYVSQQPWIQNTTLKNNILFDTQYVRRKYKTVIEACALKPDLETLPGGDSTEIGEKGINMSGGQKARVSLARAAYQDADIYLLDDPLSAVDAHVGKHIFDNVIGKKGILKNKTRILVTHAITFLPQADKIVVLKDGCVTEMGQYEELLENNGAFAEYLRTYLVEEGFDDDSSASEFAELHQKLSALSASESEVELHGSQTPKLRHRRLKPADRTLSQSMVSGSSAMPPGGDNSRLIEEETAYEGKLSYRVILAYIRAGGLLWFFTLLFSLIIFSGFQVLTNIWLSEWTNDVPVNGSFTSQHASYRLGVYGGFGVLQALAAFFLMMSAAEGCTKASKGLHESLLFGIMRAPMAFFYTTPLGRIINRFSKDMDMVDANVPIFLMNWMFAVSPLLSTVVLITYTTPIFLAFLAVIFIPYAFLERIYITYASQLKRLESIHRSPIYAHFEETVNGASSIQAYQREEAFIAKADHLIDDSQRPFFILSAAQRWLGVTIETMGATVVFCAAVLAALQTDSMEPGLAGMSISYAIQLTSVLSIMVRGATELETYMISVERIDEYIHVDSEAPLELPFDHSAHLGSWPKEGALSFYSLGCRYRHGLDLVLTGVNLDIAPGQKVGVVGRTGAGKSSLTLALFRIIEAAEGKITIDGQDISKVGLQKLRSRLTVIPQDPVMFSGSLRMNLDPAQDYTDSDIWEALEHAHLKSFVQGLNEGLDYDCGEGGDALSIGQRQLVCLARALLRRSKVLILDEATAAVDLETDALIQASIREHFNACTVITVAHRLNTVLDYDRILVLDHGKVKEFDTPANLLAEKRSVFHSLAKEAGLL